MFSPSLTGVIDGPYVDQNGRVERRLTAGNPMISAATVTTFDVHRRQGWRACVLSRWCQAGHGIGQPRPAARPATNVGRLKQLLTDAASLDHSCPTEL